MLLAKCTFLRRFLYPGAVLLQLGGKVFLSSWQAAPQVTCTGAVPSLPVNVLTPNHWDEGCLLHTSYILLLMPCSKQLLHFVSTLKYDR